MSPPSQHHPCISSDQGVVNKADARSLGNNLQVRPPRCGSACLCESLFLQSGWSVRPWRAAKTSKSSVPRDLRQRNQTSGPHVDSSCRRCPVLRCCPGRTGRPAGSAVTPLFPSTSAPAPPQGTPLRALCVGVHGGEDPGALVCSPSTVGTADTEVWAPPHCAGPKPTWRGKAQRLHCSKGGAGTAPSPGLSPSRSHLRGSLLLPLGNFCHTQTW